MVEPPPSDFYATAAQVIATCILAFAVESKLWLDDTKPAGPTTARTVSAMLLVGAVMGIFGCFGALKDEPSGTEQVYAVVGLVAAGGLVVLPVLLAMSHRKPFNVRSRQELALTLAVASASILLLVSAALFLAA